MPFTGRSNVSGRATANADSGGPVGAMAFYGDAPSGCWGPPARAARRKSDEPALDLTTKQESKGAARASTRGKYLGGIQPRDAKPPVNTEEGAAESDDDDFQIRLHSPFPLTIPARTRVRLGVTSLWLSTVRAIPSRTSGCFPSARARKVGATQSPPSSPPRTRPTRRRRRVRHENRRRRRASGFL